VAGDRDAFDRDPRRLDPDAAAVGGIVGVVSHEKNGISKP
jgi:hypothetical protein